MKTVVFQSFRTENVPPWIAVCLAGVRRWAADRGWDYRFVDDAIFQRVPQWYVEKAAGRLPVITDLGRLLLARDLLAEGYGRAVWLDADVLIFDPDRLEIHVDSEFAFGWETWVQDDNKGRLKATGNVHNALCVFTAANSMLDFYIHACLSIMERMEGPPAPQIVGPKLLTALHNIIGFRLLPQVGAFSPLTLGAIAEGGGPVLDLYRRHARGPARAVNLCLSLNQKSHEPVLERACERLLETRGDIVNG
jgi:hypothetical protein